GAEPMAVCLGRSSRRRHHGCARTAVRRRAPHAEGPMSANGRSGNGRSAVVIGAGHNGLTCALFLQRAGYRVTVVERMDRPGGLCAPVDVHPGYTLPGLLHESGLARRSVTDALGLAKHGLTYH